MTVLRGSLSACLNLGDRKPVRLFVRSDDTNAVTWLYSNSSPAFMNCCNSLGLPSMGRIVVHPVTAMISTQAVSHFIGCLHGKAKLVANGNRRGLRPRHER
jgi:hypothetical protein